MMMQKHKRKTVKLANISSRMNTGPSHSVRPEFKTPTFINMLAVDKPTAMEQLYISYSVSLKKQSGMFWAHFDALESVGLSTVSNVNCQQCSDILHIEDF